MRKFLIIIALISFLSSCHSSVDRKEIGLQLYSIRSEVKKDLNNALKMASDAGYTFVETAGYDAEMFYGKSPEEFAQLCNKYGLKFISSHTGGPDPTITPMDTCEKWWKRAITAHKRGGANFIVQPSMSKNAYTSIEGLSKYCQLFNTVGALCNEEGLKFGYHNHSKEFTTYFKRENDSIRVYDYMLQNTNPDKVFFQIDLYWIQKGGASAIEYFEKYQGRFLEWHIKDEIEVGASGEIDFEAIYKYAKQSGLKYQIVEQEGFDKNKTHFESIKQSRDFLQNSSFVAAGY